MATPQPAQPTPSHIQITVGMIVRIECPVSHYNGVVGEVFEIQDLTKYAIVDMPKGTELRLENIAVNKILLNMRRVDAKAKTKRTNWPKGDPQWFPLRWLRPVES